MAAATCRYNVPGDRFEMRSDENPNTVIFLPDANDTSRWENGPDYVVVDADDSLTQWYYKFKPDGGIDFSYCYKNKTLYEYVYNGTEYNGTEVVVDVIITSDTNITTSRRRQLLSKVPPPLERLQPMQYDSSNSNEANVERKLVSVENPGDCAKAAACMICELIWGEQKKKIRRRLGSSKSFITFCHSFECKLYSYQMLFILL